MHEIMPNQLPFNNPSHNEFGMHPYALRAINCVQHPAPGSSSHNGDLVSIDRGKETAVHAIVGSIAGHMCRLKPDETGDERP